MNNFYCLKAKITVRDNIADCGSRVCGKSPRTLPLAAEFFFLFQLLRLLHKIDLHPRANQWRWVDLRYHGRPIGGDTIAGSPSFSLILKEISSSPRPTKFSLGKMRSLPACPAVMTPKVRFGRHRSKRLRSSHTHRLHNQSKSWESWEIVYRDS